MTILYAPGMTRPKMNIIDEVFIKHDGFLLAMLGMELRRKFTDAVEQLGLSWQGQNVVIALRALAKYGPVSQKQVADFVGIDPRNLVVVIDTLEQQAILQRMPNPTDRRGYQLELTAHGQTIAQQIPSIRSKLETDMFAPLTADEKKVMHTLLYKLWEHSDISKGFGIFMATTHAKHAGASDKKEKARK